MKKVLIVDDLKPFIEQQKNILSRSDFQILTATSGQEALSIHKDLKVDLMVVDLDMPGMNGDELCSIIRKDPDMKFVSILMVTRPRESDIDRCKRCGANDYVKKPLDPKILLEKATTLLGVPTRKDCRVFVNVAVDGEKEHARFLATSLNISISGILIEAKKPLNIGDVVNCSFFLPDSPSISMKGEVARAIKKSDDDVCQYGVKFISISDASRKIIEDFIKSRFAK